MRPSPIDFPRPCAHAAAGFTIAEMTVACALLSFVLADRPILDTDYFWHLRTGAWIAETGAVPKVDPFK
jgi:hypothetical protein